MPGRKRTVKGRKKAQVTASRPEPRSGQDDPRPRAQSPAAADEGTAITEPSRPAAELDASRDSTPRPQKRRKVVLPRRKAKPSAKARAAEHDDSDDETDDESESSDEFENEEEYVHFMTTNPKSPFASMDLIVSL